MDEAGDLLMLGLFSQNILRIDSATRRYPKLQSLELHFFG